MAEERCGQEVEAGIHWILEIWNLGVFAEVLVTDVNTWKIHKEYVEYVIALLSIKE